MDKSLKGKDLVSAKMGAHYVQWRGQKAEKIRTPKRLLDKAIIISIALSFKMETSLKEKNLLPIGSEFFPL